jgi:hypothetical protein
MEQGPCMSDPRSGRSKRRGGRPSPEHAGKLTDAAALVEMRGGAVRHSSLWGGRAAVTTQAQSRQGTARGPTALPAGWQPG